MSWLTVDDVDTVIKAAVEYLLAKNEQRGIRLLLNSQVRFEKTSYPDEPFEYCTAVLLYPAHLIHKAREILDQDNLKDQIEEALDEAFRGLGYFFSSVGVVTRLLVEPAEDDWRAKIAAELQGEESAADQASPQAQVRKRAFTWNGLPFQSKTETKIAQALSKTHVLFFPVANAVAGLQKKEIDFLVCAEGRWGILEVQGGKFHPPERVAEEHERQRWFQSRGAHFFQIYDAVRCHSDPDGVVSEFLALLRST